MGLIYLLAYLLLFLSIFIFFIKRNSTCFVISFILYQCFYDWIIIHLSYFLPSGIVLILKSLQEILLSLLCFLFIYRLALHPKIKLGKIDFILFIYLFIFIIGLLVSFSKGQSISSIIQGVRLYVSPIITPYLLYKYKLFDGLKIDLLNKCFVFLLCFLLMYSVIQVYSFDGNLSHLWFYRFYDDLLVNPIDSASFNYVREGDLRATAVFVSSIHLTVTFFILTLYFYIMKIKFWPLWCILSLYGIQLTQTRVGYFLIIVCIGIGIFRRVFPNRTQYYFIPLLAIGVTLLSLIFQLISDESALGRLVQYVVFMNNFHIMGNGLGDKFALVFYDSFYISILIAFGILGVIYILCYLKILNILACKLLTTNESESTKLLTFTLFLGYSVLYLFAFQYVAGAFPFVFIWLLIFISLSQISTSSVRNG